MYFTLEIIRTSLNELKGIHPFFGITFLVFKKGTLPVGSTIEFPIDTLEKEFLEKYFKPNKDIDLYYRVMRANQPNKAWVNSDYSSSGSQSTRTRGNYSESLLHTYKSSMWGWTRNYRDVLSKLLPRKKPVSVFYLAVWLYREKDWPDKTTPEDIVGEFVKEFKLTRFESILFTSDIPSDLNLARVFQDEAITSEVLYTILDPLPASQMGNGLKEELSVILDIAQNNSVYVEVSHSDIDETQVPARVFEQSSFDDRNIVVRTINGILYILKTGCDWEQLPSQYGSAVICQTIFNEWIESGIWSEIWRTIFSHLEPEEKLLWAQAFLKGNFIPAKR
jgi:hypothetical protein